MKMQNWLTTSFSGLLGRTCALGLSLGLAAGTALAQPGTLDTSWDGDGISTKSQTPLFGAFTRTFGVQSTGKIVVGSSAVGLLPTPGNRFTLTRYNADGTIDNTFGTGGTVATYLEVGKSGLSEIKIGPNDEIYAVGTHYSGSNELFAIAKYTANGVLDNTFGNYPTPGSGIVLDPLTSFQANCTGFELLADGSLVLVGYDEGSALVVAKYLPDGSGYDTSFGTGGVYTNSNFLFATDIQLMPDGDFLIGAYNPADPNRNHIVRINADGTLDTGWAVNGVSSVDYAPFIGPTFVTSFVNTIIALAPGGKIVSSNEIIYLVGTPIPTNPFYRPVITRRNADGTLDTSFDGDGVFSATSPSLWENSSNQSAFGNLGVQANGKIVYATGHIASTVSGFQKPRGVRCVRLNTDGTLDSGFGTSGQFIYSTSPDSAQASAFMIDADGGIFIGFDRNQVQTILKLTGDPVNNGSFAFAASTPNASVAEGNSGVSTHTYTVNLSGATQFPVSVTVNLAGDAVYSTSTILTRDYYTNPAATSNQITLTFNSNGSQNVQVLVYGNTLAEGDNVVSLTLANPTNNAVINPLNNTRTHTILNDDGQATLNFTNSPAPLTVNEGNSGFKDVNMQTTLSNCGDFPFTYTFNVAASLMYGPTTYITSPATPGGTVSFTATANTVQTLVVRYYGNTVGEPDKTITVSLAGLPSFVNPSTTSRTLTILNDDGPVVQCSDFVTATAATNIGSTTARANWNVPPGVLEYEVRYGVVALDPSQWVVLPVSAPASFVDLTGLFPNSQYRYQVRFKCAANSLFSGWSNAITFSTTGSSVSCPVPSGTTEGTITSTTAAVSWNPVATAGHYQLEIKPSSSSSWTIVNVLTTNHVFSGLSPNTSYDWRVRTRCGTPVSAYSAIRTFTTASMRLGSEALEASGIQLYPNPTQGVLTLAFQAAAERTKQVRVLDVAGRVVFTQGIQAMEGRNELALDLTGQPAGVYFVQALGQTAKVVLTK